MAQADRANRYIDDKKPWVMARDEANDDELHRVLTTSLNLFRTLITWLKPVIPETAEKTEAFLQIEPLNWDDATRPLLDHTLARYKPLMTRIEEEAVNAMIEDSKEDTAPSSSPSEKARPLRKRSPPAPWQPTRSRTRSRSTTS